MTQKHPYYVTLQTIVQKAKALDLASPYYISSIQKASNAKVDWLVRLTDTIIDRQLLNALPDPRNPKRKISGILPGHTDRIRFLENEQWRVIN